MTKSELAYWGAAPYPCTIENEQGFPEGYFDNYGTFVPCGASNMGRTVIVGGVELEVVWDGSAPDPMGGHTKGRLLDSNLDSPAYVDSLRAYARLMKVPDIKDLEYEDDATTTRIGRNAALRAAGHRQAGQPRPTGT